MQDDFYKALTIIDSKTSVEWMNDNPVIALAGNLPYRGNWTQSVDLHHERDGISTVTPWPFIDKPQQ